MSRQNNKNLYKNTQAPNKSTPSNIIVTKKKFEIKFRIKAQVNKK